MNERENTQLRDRALFLYYVKTIKSHGKYAKYIPKQELYEEVGKPFFLKHRRVYDIISKMIRNHDQIALPEEIEESLELALSVYEDGIPADDSGE